MKKLIATVQTALMVAGTAFLPLAVHAANPFQNAQDLTGSVAETAEVGNQQDLPVIIGKVINILLGFIGIVLLVLVLFAGFQWMTAGGNDKQVTEAKQRISNAVVGLIILVAAFAISNFVLGSLVNVTQ